MGGNCRGKQAIISVSLRLFEWDRWKCRFTYIVTEFERSKPGWHQYSMITMGGNCRGKQAIISVSLRLFEWDRWKCRFTYIVTEFERSKPEWHTSGSSQPLVRSDKWPQKIMLSPEVRDPILAGYVTLCCIIGGGVNLLVCHWNTSDFHHYSYCCRLNDDFQSPNPWGHFF